MVEEGVTQMPRPLYKLTDENLTTQNNTRWVINEWKETNGAKQELCNNSWLHAYEDIYVAAFMYVIHVNYSNPRCFRAEGDGKFLAASDGKCGVTKLRLVEEIPLPTITKEQRVKFAILCALEVCHEASFITWANNWLSGKDRSKEAAYYASNASNAAWATSYYTDAAYDAAYYAARAAYAFADAAYNAARAAAWALKIKSFDLSAIIQKVLNQNDRT